MRIGSDGSSLEAPTLRRPAPVQLLRAFEHAPLAMALADLDDRVLYANPAFASLTGYGPGELASLTVADVTHPDDRTRAAASRRTVARGDTRTSTVEARLLRADGRMPWVSISCAAGDDLLVVQLVDVTERKQAEEELARSNADLSSFAYLAAHELKAPLQALTGFTTLLDRVHGEGMGPQAREFLGWIVDGAVRMDGLVDALLAYCQVDRSETVLAPVALDAVLGEALGQMGGEVGSRGALVGAGPLPIVTGDPVQLGQLLQNLLSNALKFVPGGRPPQIHVFADRTADGWTLTVADNGIGVADGDRERIFTMFARLHPRERYKGTGIGLAICKRIVERRGGAIWVEPNPGGGSRFRFTLPDVAPPTSTSPIA